MQLPWGSSPGRNSFEVSLAEEKLSLAGWTQLCIFNCFIPKFPPSKVLSWFWAVQQGVIHRVWIGVCKHRENGLSRKICSGPDSINVLEIRNTKCICFGRHLMHWCHWKLFLQSHDVTVEKYDVRAVKEGNKNLLKFLFTFGSFHFPLNRKYSVLFPATFTFFISTPAKSTKGTQEPPFPSSQWEYS